MGRLDGSEDEQRPIVAADRPGLGGVAAMWAVSLPRLRASPGLRRSFAAWVGAGLVLSEALAVGVAQLASPQAAVIAGVATLGWWAFASAVAVIGAALLVTPQGELVDRLGFPNGLTLMRAYSCSGLLTCAFTPTPHRVGFILWATLGTVAAMLDFVDGYIARRVGPVTRLGQALDPIMDTGFFSMAAVGNVPLGIIPIWLSALMLARYLGPLLVGIAFQFAGRRPELSATIWGKRSTIVIGATLATLLVVRVLDGPTELVAVLFAVPLGATTLLHFGVLARREREARVAGRSA